MIRKLGRERMREDREKKLKDVLFRMADMWLICNKEEEKILAHEFRRFMENVIDKDEKRE